MGHMGHMGRIRTRWFFALTALLTLAVILIPAIWITRSAQASGATITLSPGSGLAGWATQVTGSGFRHKESVTITFDAATVATTTTTTTGALSVSFVVPQTTQPGNHTVTATGVRNIDTASAIFPVASGANTWPQFGYTAQGGRFNPTESTLTPSNAAQFTQDWSVGLAGGGSIPGAAVYNGVVYVDDNSGIDALDAATGKLLWYASTMGGGSTISTYITPAVANGMVYAGGGDNYVHAFDAQTGATRWTFKTGSNMLSSPMAVNGNLYITCMDGHVYALDAMSGAELWSFQVSSSDGSVPSTPAVANGAVYFVTGNGIGYALDASTGALLWRNPFGSAWEGINAPAVDGGTVFMIASAPYPSTQGEIAAFDASTGVIKWTAHTAFYGTNGIALANGVIYVSTVNTGVYAFDEATGALRWQAPITQLGYSAPSVANGVVYVGAGSSYVYAFDAATGATLTTLGACGYPTSSPLVANGVVYMGCASAFTAFHLPGTTP